MVAFFFETNSNQHHIIFKLKNMKSNIIERLLDQGHITIEIADKILNNKEGKVVHITELKDDGIITNIEAVTLLRDDETPAIPFGVPNQTFPVMPLTYPPNYHDWTYDPNRPGTPSWTVTCSTDKKES